MHTFRKITGEFLLSASLLAGPVPAAAEALPAPPTTPTTAATNHTENGITISPIESDDNLLPIALVVGMFLGAWALDSMFGEKDKK